MKTYVFLKGKHSLLQTSGMLVEKPERVVKVLTMNVIYNQAQRQILCTDCLQINKYDDYIPQTSTQHSVKIPHFEKGSQILASLFMRLKKLILRRKYKRFI